ncbi:hypothetical protein DINM_005944 [Dirofilaria immitis]|nr:hypothetical protein [Dirofilaria immitis]
MDNSIVEYSRNQLQNVTGQIYVRPIIKSSKTRATKRINHALPKAISPFLQIFDDDDREERPITVKPKLQSTTTTATAITTITATAATTITTATSTATTATPPSTATTTATTTTASAAATATLATTITTTTTTTLLATTIGITPLTTYPIILSRLSPEADIEAKRSRIQARWRKLGPLIHSIQYPYARRNWRPVVLTDGDNSFHFSNRIKQIIKQRLEQQQQLQQQQQQQQQRRQQQQQQQEMKQINAEKFEKRPRVGGILLSNAKIKSRIFTSKEGLYFILHFS